MDRFFLGLYLILGMLFTGFASAETAPATPAYIYTNYGVTGTFISEGDLTSAYVAQYNATTRCLIDSPNICIHMGSGVTVVDDNHWFRQVVYATDDLAGWFSVTRSATGYSCPDASWTLSGSTCTRTDCLVGQIRDSSGACVRDCAAIKSTSYAGYIPTSGNPAAVCQDGCGASVVAATNQASVDGVQVIAGTFSYTGQSCTGNNITGGTPTACPVGKCAGTINGAVSCFTCADVNQSAVNYSSTSDSTIKTTTYNPDNTTSTTITDTGTGTTSSPVVDKPTEQQDYCETHPDAVQCMEVGTLGAADPIVSEVKAIDLIDPVSLGITGACPAPAQFTVAGRSYAFEYTRYCDFLIAVKPFVLAAAWLMAGIIFVGGIRQ